MELARLVFYITACCLCIVSTTSLVDATQICYGENEVLSDCMPPCGSVITCDHFRTPPVCDSVQTLACLSACVCKENYYRNGNGECVPQEYCDKCNPQTEVYGCFQRCDKTCAFSEEYCNVENCTEQCYCRQGYARDEKGVCVKYEDCSEAAKCPENEEFGCHRTCPPNRCIAQFAFFKCIPPSATNCAVRCDCEEGYSRNNAGVCIQAQDCTPADGGVPL